jgi:hypothetical protein
MINLIGINHKILEFIETLNEAGQAELWKVVNSPEYIGMIAPTLEEEVAAELDAAMLLEFTTETPSL